VIQLPSLLTIFSEQKPLKSNDHGKKMFIIPDGLMQYHTLISATSITLKLIDGIDGIDGRSTTQAIVSYFVKRSNVVT
jgi:hypothetical protein